MTPDNWTPAWFNGLDTRPLTYLRHYGDMPEADYNYADTKEPEDYYVSATDER
jgi:hypothetical protein